MIVSGRNYRLVAWKHESCHEIWPQLLADDVKQHSSEPRNIYPVKMSVELSIRDILGIKKLLNPPSPKNEWASM